MLKRVPAAAAAALAIIAAALGLLYADNDIGVQKSNIEKDARSAQKIRDEWLVTQSISDTMAALIFYPADRTDCTFSIYVNRPGLSFGYFFRGGGDIAGIKQSIAEFTVKGYREKAFLSMNRQKAERLEIDDGNAVRIIEIDSGSPFALILPDNAGSIAFYDIDGNTVGIHKEAL